jgi:hypothetical protein
VKRIELRAKVENDGRLWLEIPFDLSEAGREVRVVIDLLPPPMTQEEWYAFIDRTAGACQGDLQRPPQGVYEVRDPLP